MELDEDVVCTRLGIIIVQTTIARGDGPPGKRFTVAEQASHLNASRQLVATRTHCAEL